MPNTRGRLCYTRIRTHLPTHTHACSFQYLASWLGIAYGQPELFAQLVAADHELVDDVLALVVFFLEAQEKDLS